MPALMQMINEKVLTPYKCFMLKAQTALATGHFSDQVGFWGAVVLPQYKHYKSGTSIFGMNKGLQFEEGTSSVQMRMCSTSKVGC